MTEEEIKKRIALFGEFLENPERSLDALNLVIESRKKRQEDVADLIDLKNAFEEFLKGTTYCVEDEAENDYQQEHCF